MITVAQLARRAIQRARRRWGAGWHQLSPEAQTYQAYAAAFVIIATEDLRPDLRPLAHAIIHRLHSEDTS